MIPVTQICPSSIRRNRTRNTLWFLMKWSIIVYRAHLLISDYLILITTIDFVRRDNVVTEHLMSVAINRCHFVPVHVDMVTTCLHVQVTGGHGRREDCSRVESSCMWSTDTGTSSMRGSQSRFIHS
jgi:hypothetical protein